MATTPALVTVDEFNEMPDKPGIRMELHEGMVIEMARGKWRHEHVKANINGELRDLLKPSRLGMVLSETTYVLSEDESIEYIPDVSVLLNDRVHTQNPNEIAHGSPDIAIEVVSSETADYLAEKIKNYVRFGSKAVWVVYPKQRIVHTYDSKANPRKLEEGEYLEEPDLLPGLRLSISSIFEGI